MNPILVVVGSAFGASIGYLANRVAIWMLFHPLKPVRLGPLTIQGVIPKRRKEIAEKMSSIISHEVVTGEEVAKMTKEALERRLKSMKVPVPAPVIGSLIEGAVKAVLISLAQAIVGEAANHIDVGEYVKRKFDEISDEELEKMFKEAIGSELKYISLNDALIGAVVGTLEVMVMSLLH